MVSARKRIWGWYFFDWASQPVNTLLLTFIFGPYFAEIARGYFLGTGMEEEAAKAAAQSYWAFGLTISSLLVMVLAPILGAIADSTSKGSGSGISMERSGPSASRRATMSFITSRSLSASAAEIHSRRTRSS